MTSRIPASTLPAPGRSRLPRRSRYSAELKLRVRQMYPLCRTTRDKEELAERLEIGSLHKLYNLASRLGVTRAYDDWYDGSKPDPTGLCYDPRDDEELLKDREDPATTVFTAADDDYLRRHFGQQHLEQIAFMRDHTETAMAYRARKLGLRRAARYWDAWKVAAWLGLERRELKALCTRLNVPLHECCDRQGQSRIWLLEAEDIYKLLLHNQLWKQLIASKDADRWFIREILEATDAVKKGQLEYETSIWRSHGHTCLNPFSALCFGFFFTEDDPKMIGAHLTPADLSPRAILHLIN